jgi:hypothetical protein
MKAKSALVAGTLCVLLSSPAGAQTPPLIITGAGIAGDTLVISGLNFGSAVPYVSVNLETLTVRSATPTLLTVTAPALPAATYLLIVARGVNTGEYGFFDLTIGAVGPPGPRGLDGSIGPAGPQGEPGPPGASPFELNPVNGTASFTGGQLGIGTEVPLAALHVKRAVPPGDGTHVLPRDHVVVIENETVGENTHGLAIKLSSNMETVKTPEGPIQVPGSVSTSNNYVTFYKSTHGVPPPEAGVTDIAGRIEGLSVADFANLQASIAEELAAAPANIFGFFKLNVSFDPTWFSPGSFPIINFDPGALPQLDVSGGAPPSLQFSGGSPPSAGFSGGTPPSLSVDTTTLLGVTVPTSINFSPGALPALKFSPGSFPTPSFSPGAFPMVSLTGGRPPQLSASGGALPSISGPPIVFGNPFITTDQTKVNQFVGSLSANIKNLQTAYDIYSDPIGSAILNSTLAFGGGGVTYESGSGDYAEWLERADEHETMKVGEVVGVRGGKITKNTDGADQILVISFKPIVLGNMPDAGRESLFEKVAFMGQVPVKVNGRVHKGDYLVASGRHDGTARAIRPEDMSGDLLPQVIGVAWTDWDYDRLSFVKVAVGLRPVELARVFKKQETRTDALEQELAQMRRERNTLTRQLSALGLRLASLETKTMQIRQVAVADDRE